MYALSSSGAIVRGCEREIRRNVEWCAREIDAARNVTDNDRERARLLALAAYVTEHATTPEPTEDDDDPDPVRGPIAGWADLWDDDDDDDES